MFQSLCTKHNKMYMDQELMIYNRLIKPFSLLPYLPSHLFSAQQPEGPFKNRSHIMTKPFSTLQHLLFLCSDQNLRNPRYNLEPYILLHPFPVNSAAATLTLQLFLKTGCLLQLFPFPGARALTFTSWLKYSAVKPFLASLKQNTIWNYRLSLLCPILLFFSYSVLPKSVTLASIEVMYVRLFIASHTHLEFKFHRAKGLSFCSLVEVSKMERVHLSLY